MRPEGWSRAQPSQWAEALYGDWGQGVCPTFPAVWLRASKIGSVQRLSVLKWVII